jgi:hypothetical protein
MKRLLTLLVAVGTFTFAQAQHSGNYPNDRNRDRDVILGSQNSRVYNDSRNAYSFNERERDREIDRINKDYDKQIKKVERDRRMRSYDKDYAIRRLETQRREEIRQVWDRFHSSNNRYNDSRYQQNNRRW